MIVDNYGNATYRAFYKTNESGVLELKEKWSGGFKNEDFFRKYTAYKNGEVWITGETKTLNPKTILNDLTKTKIDVGEKIWYMPDGRKIKKVIHDQSGNIIETIIF